MKIDYWAIKEEIAEIIRANTSATTVVVEEEVLFGAENTPWVGVYLLDRKAPSSQQVLSAGRKTYFDIRFTIWCWHYALELPAAIKARDDFVSDLELTLMANRTLNDKVDTSWIEGGRMPSARLHENYDRSISGGFLTGGEIVLFTRAAASY